MSDPIREIIQQGGIAAVAIFSLYIARVMFERWCALSDKFMSVIESNTAAMTKLTALIEAQK